MRYAFSPNYVPAMPVLRVQLAPPTEVASQAPLIAVIDTGADATLFPQELLDDIGAPLVTKARIRSHWGERRSVDIFAVDLILAGLCLPSVEVIGDVQGQEVVLGRNVLNKLRLLLDGPKRYTEIVES